MSVDFETLQKWSPDLDTEQPFHFYASSWHTWKTSENLVDVIKYMESLEPDMEYIVMYVPLPAKSMYDIEWYVPAVEGCLPLGKYKTAPAKTKRR